MTASIEIRVLGEAEVVLTASKGETIEDDVESALVALL